MWLDPGELDPSRHAARVTRDIAERLAKIARALEADGHQPEDVAGFLSRCLFTFFAEDVELIPKRSFATLLDSLVMDPAQFVPMVSELWTAMDEGRFSVALRTALIRFNGKLFKDPRVIPLSREQIVLLREAAQSDWQFVEPAIFGTLLERALDPRDRHALGAHFTPRAYVERLVLPTVIEPLREEWEVVQAAALTLDREGKQKEALAELRAFQRRLCAIRVLDPACGSGNFLYVALEHLKRLEGEVLLQREALGTALSLETEGLTVDPHQFLGIEINPRAAAIAELVLWIGYLQWHFRTRGHVLPSEPVLRDFRNIECRDAILAHDEVEAALDENHQPVTAWDGHTMKAHPVTGEDVPDDAARIAVTRYRNPGRSDWPRADFVVGNPPYLGARRIRGALGHGYLEALRATYAEVPEHADFVMYWWKRAADLLVAGQLNRFGLITTKSFSQSFNRSVVEPYFAASPPVSLVFCIPNHPWVDAADGADVRVALTVARLGALPGRLLESRSEIRNDDGEMTIVLEGREGVITPSLTIGPDPRGLVPLRGNQGIACVGYQLTGQGFVVDRDTAITLDPRFESDGASIRPMLTGRDIVQGRRALFAIDLFGLSIDDLRTESPAILQHLIHHVKPERDQNNRLALRERWWIFGEARSTFRPALTQVRRYIVTSLTSKHRIFVRVAANTIADSTTVMIALDDSVSFGVLSSSIHSRWAELAGGRLGVGNDPRYNKTKCFDPFPFPIPTQAQRDHIADLADRIEAHRERQQAAFPGLTLTAMYNVVEKLRTPDALTEAEKAIDEHGLVSVLKQLHDELDLSVLAAYGWTDLIGLMNVVNGVASGTLSRENAARQLDEQLLKRLVALNTERSVEERRGTIRWLRPAFQNSAGGSQTSQGDLGHEEAVTSGPATKAESKRPWPKALSEQVRAVMTLLDQASRPLSADDVAFAFSGRGRWRDRVPQLLDMLAALGRIRDVGNARYLK